VRLTRTRYIRRAPVFVRSRFGLGDGSDEFCLRCSST
jgi:hypothetical protein